MTLTVGNLLVDDLATSFVSLADADALFATEGTAAWTALTDVEKEAVLARASRWLAVSLNWCATDLSGGDLKRVADVSARLALQAATVDLWASESDQKARRYKAGSVEIEYQEQKGGLRAGGKRFPWIMGALRGLVKGGPSRSVVRA